MSAHGRHRARHRKPRGARRERQFRNGEVRRERGFGRGGTAAASMRQYPMAGVALVGASAIAVAPVAPHAPPEIRVASPEVRLAAASLLNIPANLIADLVNIPNSEVRAIDYAARSLFFSGPWLVVGPVNLWGVDPGDPSHFRAVMHFVLPFPALSGLGLPQDSQDGLGQQLWYDGGDPAACGSILRLRRLHAQCADEPHHRRRGARRAPVVCGDRDRPTAISDIQHLAYAGQAFGYGFWRVRRLTPTALA